MMSEGKNVVLDKSWETQNVFHESFLIQAKVELNRWKMKKMHISLKL